MPQFCNVMTSLGVTVLIAMAVRSPADELSAADNRPTAELLPESTIFYAEIPELSRVIDVVFEHPLRARVEQFEPVRAAVLKKEFLAFQGAREYVESRLGMSWREAIEGLTAQGISVAFDPVTEGLAVVIRAKDEKTLTHIVDVVMELARADAKNKGKADPYQPQDYRGQTVYQVDKGYFATLGDRLIIASKSELGRGVIDRVVDNGHGGKLADRGTFQAAGPHRPEDASLWAWVDVDWVRNKAAEDGKPFQTQTDNPLVELLVGGLLDTFQKTPWLSGTFDIRTEGAALRFLAPQQAEWTTEAREYFYGPDGEGEAPALPPLNDGLFGLTTYRNVSEMWLRAGDLFSENMVDKLAEADANLTLFFSGRDFGEDILGAFEPTLQIVAARQSFDADHPTPAIKLPAFAALFQMRDPAATTRDLKRVFTSFVGFINVTGAMEGNPQLELDMPAAEGFQVVTSQFLPRVGEEESREAPIQFNFSPTVAFAGNQFILASTEGLARELAQATTNGFPEKPANTSAVLQGVTLREVLTDNQEHLIAKNMLEEGHSHEEAEQQIGLLLKGLSVLDGLSLDLTNQDNFLGLDVEIRLRKEVLSE
ncbi:MAG: hypothetical protein KDA75_02705 [Planctomycetaceae bacterium]|nr:hypothetical protein [Planctomycetaceae bacterium]